MVPPRHLDKALLARRLRRVAVDGTYPRKNDSRISVGKSVSFIPAMSPVKTMSLRLSAAEVDATVLTSPPSTNPSPSDGSTCSSRSTLGADTAGSLAWSLVGDGELTGSSTRPRPASHSSPSSSTVVFFLRSLPLPSLPLPLERTTTVSAGTPCRVAASLSSMALCLALFASRHAFRSTARPGSNAVGSLGEPSNAGCCARAFPTPGPGPRGTL
mmetsp:Transcript_63978/g.139197  ORF Transcript_63978/g.139197 Transcript_63978/m.139197 type:complete len:214 (-) Transcript_63978:220-861(-)